MSRSKVSAEERIEAAKACAEGRMSQQEAATRLGVNRTVVREWVSRYKAQGSLGFMEQDSRTRMYNLMKLGVADWRAAEVAYSRKSY